MPPLDWRRAGNFSTYESARGDPRPSRDAMERQANRELHRWAGRAGLDLDALDGAPPKGKPPRRKPAKRKSSPTNEGADAPLEEPKPLRDKFGNRYGERILTAWSEMALEALGVHRVSGEAD